MRVPTRNQVRSFFFCIILLAAGDGFGATAKFPAFDLWPSVSDRYFFTVSSSQGLSRFQYEFSASNIFANRPLDILDPTGALIRPAIDNYLGHFLSAGMGLADFWQVGMTLPVFSEARFSDPAVVGASPTVTISHVGDLRLTSKLRVVDANSHRFGLAFEPFLVIPLGGDSRYLGESKVVGGVRVIGDYLVTNRIRAAINLGTELHAERVTIQNLDYQNRFLSSLGVSASLGHGVTLSAEGQANTDLAKFFSDKDTTPVEFLGGVRWRIGKTGFEVGAGGGSCAVCGGRSARGRGFLNLAYRRVNEETLKKEEMEELLREETISGKGRKEKEADEIMALKTRCPADPAQFDPKIHDESCPKYFELKNELTMMSRQEPERFSEVVLSFRKNCPEDPSKFNPKAHDASCEKYYELRNQLVSLGLGSPAASAVVNLKTGTVSQDAFAQVVLSFKKNCPKDPSQYDPEVHDAACPKYFKLRKKLIAAGPQPKPQRNLKMGDRAVLKTLKETDRNHNGIPDLLEAAPVIPEGFHAGESGGPVHFGFNRTALSSREARVLKGLAETIGKTSRMGHREIQVIGFADSIGSRSVNKRISLKRAKTVVRLLKRLGIPEDVRLIAVGRGEEEPVASNSTSEGRRLNRRVVLTRP